MEKVIKKKLRTKKPRAKAGVLLAVLLVLLVLYAFSLLLPFLWTLISSFKARGDFRLHPFGLPEKWDYENYTKAFKRLYVEPSVGPERRIYLPQLLFNSLVYALGCAAVQVMTTCLVAYVVSKYRFKFNKVIYGIVIVTMIIPIVGSLPSEIKLAMDIGFYDNIFGIFVMRMNFLGMNFLIFYAIFKSVPWDYAEAGFIDGASHFRVMAQIMLPLVVPTMLVVGLLAFIGYWNDYYIPMIYLPSMPTAAYGLYLYQWSSDTSISSVPMQLAACMIVMIPILALFLLFKNKIIGNIAIGGIKG